MLTSEILNQYRGFLEYRLLQALDRRLIQYSGEATRILTEAVSDLGVHLGYGVSEEKPYAGGELPPDRNLRSDVHWKGDKDHIWEIDRTVKTASAAKLLAAPEPEKLWVLWAQDNDLLSLRRMDPAGIDILVLGHDIRKLLWDRLVSERFQRTGLQNALSQEERFAEARKLAEEMGEVVGATGFEPTTSCSQSKRSTRLSYAPIAWKASK